MSDAIAQMKKIDSGKINEAVFDILSDQDFAEYINATFIEGGSSSLKDKYRTQSDIEAAEKLADSIKPKKHQKFLHIVGMSGSGKSEIRKRLLEEILYLPLDELLKPFLSEKCVQGFKLFQTGDKFDSKKFEHIMYCAAFLSGKYDGYIIDHSGGSPLQPGLQALAEVLAPGQNFAIHLSMDKSIITSNIAHDVMYHSSKSFKEPVRDAIGIALDLVASGYAKEDPSRKTLVEFEEISNTKLGAFRKKYQDFCKKQKKFKSTAAVLDKFRKELKLPDEEMKMLNLHLEKSKEYVNGNEWRRRQFDKFSSNTIICQTLEESICIALSFSSKWAQKEEFEYLEPSKALILPFISFANSLNLDSPIIDAGKHVERQLAKKSIAVYGGVRGSRESSF